MGKIKGSGSFRRLDIVRLRDESLEESNNLLDPDVLALDFVDRLEAALEQFREILSNLGTNDVQTGNPGLPWHHSLQKRF